MSALSTAVQTELSQQVNSLRVKEKREMDLGKNVLAL